MPYLTKEQEKLFNENQKLVLGFLKMTNNMGHYDKDDLIGFLNEALMHAAKKYDPSKNAQFSTYAYYQFYHYYRNYNHYTKNKTCPYTDIIDSADYYDKYDACMKNSNFIKDARKMFTECDNPCYTKFLNDAFDNIIFDEGYPLLQLSKINNLNGNYYQRLYKTKLLVLQKNINKLIMGDVKNEKA